MPNIVLADNRNVVQHNEGSLYTLRDDPSRMSGHVITLFASTFLHLAALLFPHFHTADITIALRVHVSPLATLPCTRTPITPGYSRLTKNAARFAASSKSRFNSIRVKLSSAVKIPSPEENR